MASIKRQTSGRWKARYRDAAGKEHASHFGRKVDAQRWLDESTAALVTGQFVDPRAGTVPFRDYAEQWRAMQVHRDTSRAHVETMLRRHAYPTFGSRPLGSILPSEVQAWVTRLGAVSEGRKPLAPATIGVVHSLVSGVMKAAVAGPAHRCQPMRGDKAAEGPAPARGAADDRASPGGPGSDARAARGAGDVRGRDRHAPG